MAEIEHAIGLYHNIFVICAILAVLFLALTIFLFIRLRIGKVINDLSGRTKKKEIKQMEETASMNQKMRKDRKEYIHHMVAPSGKIAGTERQKEQMKQEIGYIPKKDTTVLGQDKTVLLNQEETAVLGEGETMVLGTGANFMLERQILMIHTNESITV